MVCLVAVAGSLLRAGVLGHSLGPLGHSVLGQQEPDSRLDLPGGDGAPLVVVGKPAGLSGDPLEQVVDEGVHDAHGLGGRRRRLPRFLAGSSAAGAASFAALVVVPFFGGMMMLFLQW